MLFFSIWVFFHEHSGITGLQGKEEGISLTPHCHFQLPHGHLDISGATAAGSSLLRIYIVIVKVVRREFISRSYIVL